MKGKRLLILGAAFALGISACAQATTMVRKTPLKADAQELSETFTYQSQTGTYLSYSLDQNGGSNVPNTNSDIRIYNKNTLTFAANPVYSGTIAITSVEITGKNSKSGNTQTVYYDPVGGTKVTSGSNITWGTNTSSATRTADFTGPNLSSVTFYQGGPNNVQISSATVYFTYTPAEVELSSISVSDNSGKTWYAGDTVLASDLKIVANYSNNTSSTITDGTGVTITSGALLVAGNNTISVSYTDSFGTKTGSVVINALAQITLSSIAVTTAPSKTNYYVGELFDSAGMTVTATFSDSSTSNVTADCAFSPNDALAPGDEEITISYTFKGVTKSTLQSISVNEEAEEETTFTAGTDVGQTEGNNTPDYMAKQGYIVEGTNAAFATQQYRVYANSEITLSIISGDIGKITLTGSDDKNPISNLSLKSGQPGSFADGVWTGKAQSVTLATGAQARIDTIVIEKATNEPSLTLDVASISLKTNETAGKQVVATVLNVENPAFVWTPADNKVTVEVVSTVNGVQTVKIKPNSEVAANTSVSLAITGTTLTASVSVEITVPGPGETAETAYSVAQARAAIDADDGITGVYATGIVSKIVTAYNSQYGNISYDISADGTTESDQLRAYRGKGINGANFTSADDIEIGATVVVYGNLTKYNDVYEFAEGNQLVSIVRPSHGVDYYLDRGSSFAELHGHENKTVEQQATVSKTIAEIAEEENYTISTSGSEVCYTSLDLDSNINVSTNGAPNCGSIWGTTNSDWRLYHSKAGDLVITASNGFKLTSATITFTDKNSGILTLNGKTVSSGTPVALNGSEATFDVGNSNNANDGQIRVTEISVSYEKSTFESVDSIQLKFGASISENDWNAIVDNNDVQEYGVKLFTSSSSTFSSETPVQDAITGGKTPATVSKAYTEALEIEDGLMTFTITINIKNTSAYGTIFCAAPFIKVDGHDYFFPEIQGSVNSVAQDCLTNNDYSLLSRDALLVLAGN